MLGARGGTRLCTPTPREASAPKHQLRSSGLEFRKAAVSVAAFPSRRRSYTGTSFSVVAVLQDKFSRLDHNGEFKKRKHLHSEVPNDSSLQHDTENSNSGLLSWRTEQHTSVSTTDMESSMHQERAPSIEDETVLQNYCKSVSAIILAGGKQDSTNPLTFKRCASAAPISGTHRLIDIGISNCLNSGVRKMFVLTQWNSASLNSHISKAYPPQRIGGISKHGFVEVLAANQSVSDQTWTTGSADAVRRHLWSTIETGTADPLHGPPSEDYLILSGEAIYGLNFGRLIAEHRLNQADITIATVTMPKNRASRYGNLTVDGNGCVQRFVEKPEMSELDSFEFRGPSATMSKPCTVSTGIYVFSRRALCELLSVDEDKAADYSALNNFSDVLPQAIADGYNVRAYEHYGYWRDVSTLKDFYEANLKMAERQAPFCMYDEAWPIYTMRRHLPPSTMYGCHVDRSLIGEGCIIRALKIQESVVGNCTNVGEGCVIDRCFIVGSDNVAERTMVSGEVGIGRNCVIRGAVVDRNARIGDNCVLVNKENIDEANHEDEGYVIKDGIIFVLQGATIPSGTVV